MKVLFLNNSGGGFADYVETTEGTNIETFLTKQVHGYKAGDLLIRVNRQPVAKDYVLQDGDRVSATPVKIEGAASRRLGQGVKLRCKITPARYMRSIAA